MSLPTQSELDLLAKHVANHADLKLVRTGFNRMTLPAIQLYYKPEGLPKDSEVKIMSILIRKLIGDAGGDFKTTRISIDMFPDETPISEDYKQLYHSGKEEKKLFENYDKDIAFEASLALHTHHLVLIIHFYLW